MLDLVGHLRNTPGVYALRNTRNGKIYIGSSNKIRKRVADHILNLRKGNHKNVHLQSAWSTYGSEAFVIEVLQLLDEDDRLLLREAEEAWIKRYQSHHRDFGYNIDMATISHTGKVADESRWKMSLARQGIKISEVTRQRMSESRRGHPVSEETRRKIRQAKLGWKAPQETIERLRQSHLGQRVSHSPDTRRKIGAANARCYRVTSPAGISSEITNLTEFCRQNGLHPSAMVRVSRGKSSSHKGWTCERVEKIADVV